MLDVITRRGDLELTLQIGAEILGSEDPRNRGDHPDKDRFLRFFAPLLYAHSTVWTYIKELMYFFSSDVLEH